MSRTNIDIDDELMAAVMTASGQKTKRGAVEEAMRRYVRIKRQLEALENLRGLGWDGDLNEMRRDREFDEYGNRIDE